MVNRLRVGAHEDLLIIPMEWYGTLLSNCTVKLPEYRVLKNGILVLGGETGDRIEVLCDPEGAKLVMNLAGRVCAEAIPFIQQIADWFI
jgi:hypothetical protein